MTTPGNEIIPAVLRKIEHCESVIRSPYVSTSERCENSQCAVHRKGKQWAAGYRKAADRLRDFATVELLCEGLGITREQALTEDEDYCCGGCGAALEETYGFPWHLPDEDCRKIRNSEALNTIA